MSTTQSLTTLGCLCQMLQRSPDTIRKAMQELSITPAMIINMRAHYADEDVERIREHLARQGGNR